jgi:anti-sigma-K factor RskA
MTADIHTLAGAYALDALTDDEQRLFERHLAMSGSCSLEVAEFRRTAALLGAAQDTAPPSSLRDGVLAAIEVTPQARPGVRGAAGLRARIEPLLVPMAAGLALALLVLSGVVLQQRSQLERVQAAQEAREEVLLAVLTAPDAARLVMAGEGRRGMVLWSPSAATGVLVARGLGTLPAGRAYQLWLMRGGVPVPSAVFTASAGGEAIVALGTVAEGFDAVAVTIEDERGAAAPSGAMVLAPA